jgi:hypothetical protein
MIVAQRHESRRIAGCGPGFALALALFVLGGTPRASLGACTGAGMPCEDDGNPCTDDVCDGAGVCTHPDNTAPCDDGVFCNGADVCANGTCEHAGDPCAGAPECADVCDEGSGTCATPAGTPCADDGQLCTDDQCDGFGACVHLDNAAFCDDGDPCTTGDMCQDGICRPGAPLVCDDHNPCTDDTCDSSIGCVFTNVAGSCDDGDACTTGDHCDGGACEGGAPRDCDDGNDCTDDGCDPASGCTHVPNADPCDDGNACTMGDACAGGVCVGGPARDCNDGNLCTTDGCSPAAGCTHTNNTVACSDGDGCTTNDHCGGGTCVGGPPANCDDGDSCTTDSCMSPMGCVHDPVPSCCSTDAQCAGTDQCTTNERCVGHRCVSDPVPCDDGNPCTDDGCNPTSGCTHVANNASCDDGDACTTGDGCQGGVCRGGPQRDCRDSNVCTDDGCSPATGCTHVPNTAPCDDGSFCTTGDTCSAGACVGGPPPDCDDDNPCTTDSCQPNVGCRHVDNTDACDDHLFCTVGDRCSGGACVGTARDCTASGDQCRIGTCDEGINECVGVPKPDGTACNDGSACTSGETCTSGVCAGGTGVVCGPCETCDTTGGCKVGPRPNCRESTIRFASRLSILDRGTDTADLVTWKLGKSAATVVGDFGNPVSTTSYTFCIFDKEGLAMRGTAPAGGTCGPLPCWKALHPIGFRYTDKSATPEGVTRVLLKSGGAGKAKEQLKAKGADIPVLRLPLVPPVTAQLQSSAGHCWETRHDGPGILRNDGLQFKAKND